MEDMDKESCVVRIVYLDDSFTETALKSLILMKCQPQGNIKIYLKRNDEPNIFFAYIIFEHSHDASKTVGLLNGHVHISNKLEVELIGPNLPYRKYIEPRSNNPFTRKIEALRLKHKPIKQQLFSKPFRRTYDRPNGLRNVFGNSTNPGIAKYNPSNLSRRLIVQSNAYDENP